MKLLVDNCVAGAVALRLRADAHDVICVSDRGADPGDAAILALAVAEGRVLVTIDNDFGMLVFRDGAGSAGVVRLRDGRPAALAERASQLVSDHAAELLNGAFVTDDGANARVAPQAARASKP